MEEYAVLNVPGFKIVRGSGDSWVRHGKNYGERATTPYQNPHRWWKGITDEEVAEYVATKSKVDYWKDKKKKRDFNATKFAEYEAKLIELEKNEGDIFYRMADNPELKYFIPKGIRDAFIF